MIRGSRCSVALVCSAFLLACGSGGSDEAADEGAPAATAADEQDASSLAQFAGTWSVLATTEAGDTVTTYQLSATDRMDGWTITFPGRDPLPMRVISAAGDSVITEVGPYESVTRPGVQVTTRSVTHVRGDQVTGTFRAEFVGVDTDPVLTGRTTGSRVR